MAKVNFDETFEIYLFTKADVEGPSSKLSEFLSYTKFNKVSPSLKFSYVGPNDALIPELTLNENILMDYSPDSLTAAKEFQFQEFLKEKQHHDLELLYKKVALPHELPLNTDTQMKKVSALIKALIFEGQFIFLEEPEKDLDSESISLFINALKSFLALNKQNVFVYSNNPELWMPHAHKHVERKADYSFSTKTIETNWQWKKERQEFFAPKNSSETKTLRFHLPKKQQKKSA